MAVTGAFGWFLARRGGPSLLAAVLVIGIGVGAALTAWEAAERTRTAYPDYLDRSEVADLVVNPQIASARVAEIIAEVPGVASVTSDSLISALPEDDGRPLGSAVDQDFFTVVVSQDGRYRDQDRPIVRDGRMVESGQEAFISLEVAESLDLAVGDELPLAFYVESRDPTAARTLRRVGSARPRVVGIGSFADEVLPDELYPRRKVLVSPEVAEGFDCLVATPDPDDPRSFEELTEALFPVDCTMSFRYYSVAVDGGGDRAAEVAAELGRRFAAENEQLPEALRSAAVVYQVIPSFAEEDARAVRQSLAPTVTALRVFALTAGAATFAVVALLLFRLGRRRVEDLALARGLGLATGARARAVGMGPALAVAAGITLALGSAFALSPLGPLGSARRLVPDPSSGLTPSSIVAAAVALALLGGTVAVAAWRASVTVQANRQSPRRRSGIALSGSPLVALGLGAASRGREAVTGVMATLAAVTAVTAMLVFAVALDRLVGRPERFGWPFDVAFVVNAGYGPVDLAAAADLFDRSEVDGWGLALMGDLTVEGESVTAVGGRRGFDELVADTSVVDGRVPAGADEVALGALTAERLDVDVGDEVTLGGPFGEHEVRVSGLVVLPAVGPLESSRASLGTGVLVPRPALDATFGEAEAVTGQPPPAAADQQAGLVIVDLADGVDVDSFLADLGDVSTLGASGFPVLTVPDAVRPAPIVDLDAVRGVPALLAGGFALAMALGVVASIAAGTRARRTELAALRSVGATPGQCRTTVRVHALATVALGLLVGLPVGVALGRTAFRYFAEDLGVAADAPVPAMVPAVVGVGALVLALVTAEVVARRWARQSVWAPQVSRSTAGPKSSLWTYRAAPQSAASPGRSSAR